MNPTLPRLLSGLVDLAARDIAAVHEDPDYRFMSLAWHSPMDGICHVCIAGAVLAKSVGLPPSIRIDRPAGVQAFIPGVAGERVMAKLHALDDVRIGRVDGALRRLGQRPPDGVSFNFEGHMTTGHFPEPGLAILRSLAARLALHGL